MGVWSLTLLILGLAFNCVAEHGPFYLKISSNGSTLGYAYGELVRGDQAGMFLNRSNTPAPFDSHKFYYNATNATNAPQDVSSGGVLYTYALLNGDFTHMYLSGNAGSNVAAAWFQLRANGGHVPLDPTQGVWIAFDPQTEKMFIWGWDDSVVSDGGLVEQIPPVYVEMYRWYLCDTYVVNSWNRTLSWVGGKTPSNPTCEAVDVVMEMA